MKILPAKKDKNREGQLQYNWPDEGVPPILAAVRFLAAQEVFVFYEPGDDLEEIPK